MSGRFVLLGVAALLVAGPVIARSNMSQNPILTGGGPGGSTVLGWERAVSAARAGTYTAGAAGTTMSQPTRAVLPSGAVLEGTAKRLFSGAGLAAAARVLGGPGMAVATTVLPLLLDALRDKTTVETGMGGGIYVDPGQGKTAEAYCVEWGEDCLPGADVANRLMTAYAASNAGASPGWSTSYSLVESRMVPVAGGMQYHIKIRAQVFSPEGAYGDPFIQYDTMHPMVIRPACPGVSLPVVYRRTGSPCPSDVRSPATDADVQDLVKKAVENPDTLRDVTEEIATADPAPGPIADTLRRLRELWAAEPETEALTGPSSLTLPGGGVRTSTGADGKVTTKTTSIACNYGGTSAWCTEKTITTTTSADGTTTTETEEGPSETDTRSECEKSPKSIGCAEFGEPEEDVTPRDSENIEFDSVSLGGSGSCPADKTFSVMGNSYAMSYEPICNAATTYVKPFVLLACSLLAAMIFIGGLKS